jgi:cobalamin biosynthesis Mg chelatase CobN
MARATKRRRTTKHRGNAAGMIEARGRTGRKPTAAERGSGGGRGGSGKSSRSSGSPRARRYESAPTWKSAGTRAVVAAIVVYAVSTLLLKRPIKSNLVLLPIVLALYAPMIYYTDLWMYRRNQRKKAKAGS